MKKLLMITVFALIVMSTVALAEAPRVISIQGKLTNTAGNPITSAKSAVFNFYDASTSGNLLWTASMTITPDSSGIFNAEITLPSSSTLDFSKPYWVGIVVDSQTLGPRVKITSSAYTMSSQFTNGLNVDLTGLTGVAGRDALKIISTDASNAAIVFNKPNLWLWSSSLNNFGLVSASTLNSTTVLTNMIYSNISTLVTVNDNLAVTNNVSAGNVTIGNLTFNDEIMPDGSLCSNTQILQKTGANNWDCVNIPSVTDVWVNTTGDVMTGKLNISDTVQSNPRIVLSGQEFYQAGNLMGSGIALLLGVNRAANRQLWIGDSANLAVNNINTVVRISPNGWIDSVATDGTTAKNLSLQPNGGNVGIGTTTPAVKLKVAGSIHADTTGGNTNLNTASYSISGTQIGGQTFYAYGSLCAGGSSGDCTGTGGTKMNSTHFCIGTSCINSWATGGVSGSGTANYLSKWTSGTVLGNSMISEESGYINFKPTSGSYGLIIRRSSDTQWIDIDASNNEIDSSIGAINFPDGITSQGSTVWHAGNDGSGTGLDADTADGLHVHAGTNNEANKIVRTDGNGYILAGWINTPSGEITSGITKIYASGDNYIRYVTPATLISQLGLSTSGHTHSYVPLSGDSNIGGTLNVQAIPTTGTATLQGQDLHLSTGYGYAGVWGRSTDTNGKGVWGTGYYGVYGESPSGYAVYASGALGVTGNIVADSNTRGTCSWTLYYSEENGTAVYCPNEMYVAGIGMIGSYSDNVRLYCCEL